MLIQDEVTSEALALIEVEFSEAVDGVDKSKKRVKKVIKKLKIVWAARDDFEADLACYEAEQMDLEANQERIRLKALEAKEQSLYDALVRWSDALSAFDFQAVLASHAATFLAQSPGADYDSAITYAALVADASESTVLLRPPFVQYPPRRYID